MNREAYDKIWKNCIEPAANEITLLYPEKFRNEWGWKFDNSETIKNSVYNRYDYYRSVVHDKLYKGRKFDVHKITACFARSIIEVSPFYYRKLKNIPEQVALSNYWLGLVSGLYMIRFFLFYSYRRINSEFSDGLLDTHLEFPETTPGHDSYLLGRVRAMAVNDGNKLEFDLLGCADMLFWIEYYNRQLIENAIKPQILRSLV